jgi:hypothetical protein
VLPVSSSAEFAECKRLSRSRNSTGYHSITITRLGRTLTPSPTMEQNPDPPLGPEPRYFLRKYRNTPSVSCCHGTANQALTLTLQQGNEQYPTDLDRDSQDDLDPTIANQEELIAPDLSEQQAPDASQLPVACSSQPAHGLDQEQDQEDGDPTVSESVERRILDAGGLSPVHPAHVARFGSPQQPAHGFGRAAPPFTQQTAQGFQQQQLPLPQSQPAMSAGLQMVSFSATQKLLWLTLLGSPTLPRHDILPGD